jgi:hypothetical protein
MLTFLTMLGRSVRIVAGLMAVDFLVSYALTLLSYAFVETLGDFMLFEAAILFILAGLLDFTSSIGGTQFRKVILGSREDYSSSKHKEAERKAAVFFIGGFVLLLLLVIFALYIGT